MAKRNTKNEQKPFFASVRNVTSSPVVTRGPYSDMMHDIASPKAVTVTGKTQKPIVPIHAPGGLTKGLTK